MSSGHQLPWETYVGTLKPHERPTMPGSPATPDHPTARRFHYAAIGVLVALSGALGNAVIGANLQNLQGSLGVTAFEAAWLPIVFVMTNACMNLILIKFRMQYGLRLFTKIFLAAFVATSLAHLFVNDYGSTLAVRAVSGMAAAGLSSLGFLYMLQAFPAKHRLKGLIVAIGLSSFATPIARLLVPQLLQIGEWRGFYIFELGLALVSLAAMFSLRLPPSARFKAFDKLDFVTFALFAPGVGLLCAVLGLGRIVWWTEAPWIGWALAGSITLLAAALIVEHNRRRPLINTQWLAGGDIVRLAIAILIVRIVLSEQTSGAVGFLQVVGLGPDQLHGLFWVILAATAAGTLTSAFTLNMEKLNLPIAIALGLIAIGAFIDSHATVLTRPANLYFSQALLAFAAALFIGPAMMIGISNVMKKGTENLISFIVIFSVGQNVGGLAGGALVGTVQVIRQRFHAAALTDHIVATDPQAALRLQQLSGAYGRTVSDPALRNVEGLRLLNQQITQQANVLAFNDVFLMIAVAAALGALWVAIVHLKARYRARRVELDASSAQAAAAVAAVD